MRRVTLAIAVIVALAACGDDGGTALFDTQGSTTTVSQTTEAPTTTAGSGGVEKKDPSGFHGLTSKAGVTGQDGGATGTTVVVGGSDPRLDVLWDDCASGDMEACDSLYLESPIGSQYEAFGYTCGNTVPTGGPCAMDDSAAGDPYFDDLQNQCASGNWAACDSLYMESPLGSAYEQFGATCGGLTDGSEWCVDAFATDASELDMLYQACAGGDWEACDWLYVQSDVGSDYEAFGATCGGLTDGTRWCVDEFGTSSSYGDDPYLDGLWDACAAGDWAACDTLFMDSPVGSEYEDFGNTCGYITDGGTWCADSGLETQTDTAYTYGDDPVLDALWDGCAAGDWQACDDLYFQSPFDSEYETFGGTCGLLTDGMELCVVEMTTP